MSDNSTHYYLRWFALSFAVIMFTAGATPITSSISSLDLASESEELKAPFKVDVKRDEDGTPVIEYALDQLNKIQNAQSLINGGNNVANKNCSNCEDAVSKARFMTCSDKNNYLEKEIQRTAQEETILGEMARDRVKPDGIIKPACIEMGMNLRFGEKSSTFRTCDAKGNLGRAVRPCISENYFRLITNSFDLVSSCMAPQMGNTSSQDQKLDVRAIYALINVESGFHVNAMSGTGAGGIGQFTSAAITDVNRNEMSSVRIALEGSQDPRCVRMSMELLDTMTPMRPEKGRSCDRISIAQGNPMKNMIYTYAYLKGVKKSMDRVIFNNSGYAKKFSKLSSSELNKIKRALMVWSHNAGPAGTWTPAKALLNSVYRTKQVTNADDFINQMQSYMQKFPASANNNAGRRKETSGYFPTITKTLNQIENSAGGGSCVN